jgi:phospholipid-binding lipoprotein MlaA
MTPRRFSVVMLSWSLAMAGCATVPTDPAARAEYRANHDPFEPLNRRTFAFNLFVDRVLIKPVAEGYRKALPARARDAFRHFLDNLNEPLVFVNTVLQGRLPDAGTTGFRFLLNSTFGIVGFIDVATPQKLPKQVGDFGQTLWRWGLPGGPYLIIPVFGPTNPRDGIGSGVDLYIDPFRYIARKQSDPNLMSGSRVVADGIDKRSRSIDALDEMQRESVDYYASFRSFFRQHRDAELRGGGPEAPLPPPNFYDDTR